jgi:16S rRNA (guanine527-N7)-methyltransferase
MQNLLINSLSLLNIKLYNEYIDILIKFWNYLIDYNKKVNLISKNNINNRGFIIHIIDSLSPLILPWPDNLSYLDIGSGGGLPGIPLKIVHPGWNTLLAESTHKKAVFLQQAGQYLGLEKFGVLNRFLEPKTALDKFDFVTTRGLAVLSKTIPLIANYLPKDGLYLSFKGPLGLKELHDAENSIKKYKFVLEETREFILPYINAGRTLLLFRKL